MAAETGDGTTNLTIRVRLSSVAIRDAMVKLGMNEGWSQSLERLEGTPGDCLTYHSGDGDCSHLPSEIMNTQRLYI
jgi:hypothetical protein